MFIFLTFVLCQYPKSQRHFRSLICGCLQPTPSFDRNATDFFECHVDQEGSQKEYLTVINHLHQNVHFQIEVARDGESFRYKIK